MDDVINVEVSEISISDPNPQVPKFDWIEYDYEKDIKATEEAIDSVKNIVLKLRKKYADAAALMDAKNYEEAIVYILHDNDNWNHYHVRGFYVIPSDNYIFYFYE